FGAVVNFVMPTATDIDDPEVEVLAVPPSGATFPVGTTTVTCTATDGAGNVTTASFEISVRDTIPPVFVAAPDLVFAAPGPAGASVTYTQPRVADWIDPNPAVTCSIPSGATFPLGTTTVTCAVMDRAGNVSTSSFHVTVKDTPVWHDVPQPVL